MNNRTHARLAKRLIDACGGVDEIVREKACRLSFTKLYDATRPDLGYYLAADVIADLEEYCGQALYSAAMAEARPTAVDAADLVASALSNTEFAAAFQALAREAVADGVVDAAERKRMNVKLDKIEDLMRAIRALVDGGRT